MREDCLELLAKLDKCMEDPDFQIIIIMKFMRSLSPYLRGLRDEGGKDNL
jgi:hypothetical protein